MRKKTKIIIGSLFLAGALTAGVLCAGYASRGDNGGWFENSDVKTWHWSDKSDDKGDMTDDTEDMGVPTEGGETETAYTSVQPMMMQLSVESDTNNDQSVALYSSFPEYDNSYWKLAFNYAVDLKISVENELLKFSEWGEFSYSELYWMSTYEHLHYYMKFALGKDLPNYSDLVCIMDSYTNYEFSFAGGFVCDTYTWDGESLTVYATYSVYDEYADSYSDCPIADNKFELYKITAVRNKPSLPIPADPVKEGYTFVGWYYDEEYTRRYYYGEPIYEDTQLYAKFRINRYTVSFDSNGGSDLESQTVEWNTGANLSCPVRKGYDFKGWYLSDGTEYTNQPIKEDTTLTAHWEVQTFTVTFYVEGEIYDTFVVEYGTAFSVLSKQAWDMSYSILSICSDGALIDSENFASFTVTNNNVAVELGELSTKNKVVKWFENNKWYLIGGACGAVALAVIGGIVYRKKRT